MPDSPQHPSVTVARIQQRTWIIVSLIWATALLLPIATDHTGQRQPLLVALAYAFTAAQTETVVSSASAIPTVNTPAEPTQTIITACPQSIDVPASGLSEYLNITVPAGEIAFIRALEVNVADAKNVFVTITGPYEAEIEVRSGVYCYGIAADSNYDTLIESLENGLPAYAYYQMSLP